VSNNVGLFTAVRVADWAGLTSFQMDLAFSFTPLGFGMGFLEGILSTPTVTTVPGGSFNADVRLVGGPQLQAAVRGMRKELNTQLRAELREIAEDVAQEARRLAPVRTGRLQRSIRTFARGNALSGRAAFGVAASARDRLTGYAYPKRLEYERGPRGRPFLEPAYQRKERQVDDAIRAIDRRLAAIWGS
jgi:hypothetical protein